MISLPLAKNLVRYRCWTVAVVNAGVTWVILIIAPLGLFAVIICTAAVFLSSLGIGLVCDRALYSLLNAHGRDVMRAMREPGNLETDFSREGGGIEERSLSPEERRRNLPEP